jgi:arylformamidase
VAIYDISLPLQAGMVVYEGDPPFESTPVSAIERDGFAVTRFALGSHTGTHLDAPAHFIAGGLTVDQVPLDILCGPARVLDLRGEGLAVDRQTLERHDWHEVRRVLLQTVSGPLPEDPFMKRHAHLTPDAAHFLRDQTDVCLVGIDALSIEAEPCPGFPVHHALLASTPPIVILEAIDLRGVPPADYELVCLPLRLRGADGAPARACLRPRQDARQP